MLHNDFFMNCKIYMTAPKGGGYIYDLTIYILLLLNKYYFISHTTI